MTDQSERIRILGVAVVAAISLGILLFAPGIGCSSTTSSNVHRDARDRASSRHRYESLTQYMNAKAKALRKQREEARAKAVSETQSTPQTQAAFRAGVVIGIWNRFVGGPTRSAKSNQLPPTQLKRARSAAQALDNRLLLLKQSAQAAKLPELAQAADAARSNLARVSADLSRNTFTPQLIIAETDLINNIKIIAKRNGLKVLIKVPAGSIKA